MGGADIIFSLYCITLSGITGVVSIDTNGDRVSDFSLLDMDSVSEEYQVNHHWKTQIFCFHANALISRIAFFSP